MTDDLTLTIAFHGPFHVFTGSAGDSRDAVIDETIPVPPAELKGLMRASAVRLGLPDGLIREVFGAEANRRSADSPWGWRCGDLVHPHSDVRASVPIDPESGTARAGAIRMAEELWASSLDVHIERIAWIERSRLPQHHNLLLASALSITSLGHDRNRGFGWVSLAESGTNGAQRRTRAAQLAAWIIDQREGVA